jgi:hypothetical protein
MPDTKSGQFLPFCSLLKRSLRLFFWWLALSVGANIVDKVYQTGRKAAEDFKQTMKIVFDQYLPQ